MSLRLQPIGSIPEQTALVAHAAFPKGHPYLTLRDHLGTIFQDEDFATPFRPGATRGCPPGGLPS
jgi:transposase